MNFVKEKIKDFYLLDSKVENIFINEYMPAAPGDFVKVFLYGEMYAEFGLEMSNETMAKQLGITEKKIQEAWAYWEKMGAIKKHYVDESGSMEFAVEFINLKELLYGKSTTVVQGEKPKQKVNTNVFGNEKIKELFYEIEKTLSRSLSSSEITNIISWITDYQATPEVILFGIAYCVNKNKTSMKYIEKVIKGWTDEGFTTVDLVSEHLHQIDEKYYRYKRVLNALGFTRNATEAEKKMMDEWFDQMGYNMDKVLDACTKTAGISNPNFNYVNKVLENWKNKADDRGEDINKKNPVSQAVLNQYFDYLRAKADREADERREEVYSKLPRIKEIDEESGKNSAELSRALILGTSNSNTKEIKERMDQLAVERAVLLTENNFEMDYTDIKYACDKCNDTGITDLGERCSCINKRLEEAEIWQKKQGK